MAFGSASIAASPGLGAFALAVMGVGAGVALAGAGIGAMAFGLAHLVKSSKGAGTAMLGVGAGIAGIGAGLMIAGNPIAATGLAVMTGALAAIALVAPRIGAMGAGFAPLVQLKGMAPDFRAAAGMIKTISGAKLGELKHLSELHNIFSKPLKVEFSDKEVAVVSNVTLKIDGYEFYEKTSGAARIAEATKSLFFGKSSSRD
jgi:hypothetical protein